MLKNKENVSIECHIELSNKIAGELGGEGGKGWRKSTAAGYMYSCGNNREHKFHQVVCICLSVPV